MREREREREFVSVYVFCDKSNWFSEVMGVTYEASKLTKACFTYFGLTTHLDFARLKRLNYLIPLLHV